MLRGDERRIDVIHLVDKAVGPPSATNHGAAVAADIVGKAETGVEVGKTVGLSAEGTPSSMECQ